MLLCKIVEHTVACREASSAGHELDVPQQFGVWQVSGLGIVVAFRGTASQEDVIIDANIGPVPLDAARPTRGQGSAKSPCQLDQKQILKRRPIGTFSLPF